MNATDDLAQRLAELETRAAHQEQAIQDLSDVTARQWDAIDDLVKRLDHLKNRVSTFEDTAGGAPGDEPPPPHY